MTEPRVRAIAREAATPLELLEVGAGDGAFVRRVTPDPIPAKNILCTEYSDYGLARLQSLGVACSAADFRNLPAEYAQRFDVVCMFQVLEHLDDLDGAFGNLSRLTRAGAHLFVAVPNEHRIAFNEDNGTLLDLPPNHVGRWTRAGFEAISSRHGWRLVEHQVERSSIRDRIVAHLTYRYMRKRQQAGTAANRAEQVRMPVAKRALQVALAALYGGTAIPSTIRLTLASDLGDSQWAHMVKGS